MSKVLKFLNNSIVAIVIQLVVLLLLFPMLLRVVNWVLPDQGQTFVDESAIEVIGEFSKDSQVVIKIATTIDKAIQQIDTPLEKIVMDGAGVIRELSTLFRDLVREMRALGVTSSSGASGSRDDYGDALDGFGASVVQFFSDILAAIIPTFGMIFGVMLSIMTSNAQNWCILLCILCLKTMVEDGLKWKFLSAPLSVMGVFCGVFVWALYGGQLGETLLLLLAIIFLLILNFVLRLLLRGFSFGKTILGCTIDVMQEAFSICYLYGLTQLLQYPPVPMSEIVAILLITSGVLVLSSWLRKLA